MSTVLIVEDDLTLQEAYSFILESAGHQVHTAFNGREALDAIKEHHFDLILLDLHMPVMNGWEFLQAYQPYRSLGTIIILFSNMVEPDTSQEAEKFGVTRTILKSTMTPSAMLELVNSTTLKS